LAVEVNLEETREGGGEIQFEVENFGNLILVYLLIPGTVLFTPH
jgi:hypothetical protein